MLRLQRGRRHRLSPAAQPYRRRRDRRRRAGLHTNGTCLPDDALADIFTRLPGTADVVRCTATCARWAYVVATRAAVLSRSLPPLGRFLPQLAVGFFCQENDRVAARTRGSVARFLAMGSGSRLLGCHHRSGIGSLFHVDDLDGRAGTLHYSRLVASRSGHLVVELQHRRRTDGLTFCVCNPITRDVSELPPLPGKDMMPASYVCTLLTGDDLDPLGSTSTRFFRLLLVYNRPGFTVLRCYASEIGNWGAEVKSSVDVSDKELRHVGPAVVLRGVAFWLLNHGVLGVRLDLDAQDPNQAMHAHRLLLDHPYYWREKRMLGVSPDNRLFFMYCGIHAGLNILFAQISYLKIPGDDLQTGRHEPRSFRQSILMHQMKMKWRGTASLKLRWIGEKSGIVLFTMGESSGHSGTFTLNLRDETVQKVADGEGHQGRNLLGFEMDREAYLASLAHGQEN